MERRHREHELLGRYFTVTTAMTVLSDPRSIRESHESKDDDAAITDDRNLLIGRL